MPAYPKLPLTGTSTLIFFVIFILYYVKKKQKTTTSNTAFLHIRMGLGELTAFPPGKTTYQGT